MLHRFVALNLEESDGSLYITLLREGKISEATVFDSESGEKNGIKFDNGRPKRKKISYHASGRINYHNTNHPPNYCEPISEISQLNLLQIYSVPSIEKLDQIDNLNEDDCIFEPEIKEGRIDFCLYLAPWDTLININHVAVRYKNMFSLIISAQHPNSEWTKGLDNHFITVAPKTGFYTEQKISNEQALISFHQMLHSTKNIIVYSPNREGIYKIIFAVPMRRAPDMSIELHDENYNCEIVSANTAVVTFKVRDKHKNVIKTEMPIKSILASAEL